MKTRKHILPLAAAMGSLALTAVTANAALISVSSYIYSGDMPFGSAPWSDGTGVELTDGITDTNTSVVGWWPANDGTITFDLGTTVDVQTIDLWARLTNGSIDSIDVSVSTDDVTYSTPVNYVNSWSGGGNPSTDQLDVSALGNARYYRLQLINDNDWSMLGEVQFNGISVGPGGNDFSDWIALYPGVGGQTAIGDDPDGDGNDNGVENFFGTAPDEFTQGLVSGTEIPDKLFVDVEVTQP